MSSNIRVATVHELPPGKGRVVEIAGRCVTVYNRDGRFFATASHGPRYNAVPVDTSVCLPQGQEFDVWMEDSPARLGGEPACLVRVDGDEIFLVID
jgi:nitrite reductase/ring-hydroxylating ferredoxin subunit